MYDFMPMKIVYIFLVHFNNGCQYFDLFYIEACATGVEIVL